MECTDLQIIKNHSNLKYVILINFVKMRSLEHILEKPRSVSYTHLDVYKRQEPNSVLALDVTNFKFM